MLNYSKSWRAKSRARKIAAVIRQLGRPGPMRSKRGGWYYASAIGIKLGISEATAAKYLREAVKAGRAEADPSLEWTKLGAAARQFRIKRAR